MKARIAKKIYRRYLFNRDCSNNYKKHSFETALDIWWIRRFQNNECKKPRTKILWIKAHQAGEGDKFPSYDKWKEVKNGC
ncbi:MAG: hypothetical protein ACW99G_12935 [Candidatus Thorarchaeota archaeon]